MRRKLSKAERQKVYQKCGGCCAYCGQKILYKEMQIDHMKPLANGGADEISNMLPACRSCNHYKATLDVEGFRRYLGGIPARLMRDSIPFQVGRRFDLVAETGNPVAFYFEMMDFECPYEDDGKEQFMQCRTHDDCITCKREWRREHGEE